MRDNRTLSSGYIVVMLMAAGIARAQLSPPPSGNLILRVVDNFGAPISGKVTVYSRNLIPVYTGMVEEQLTLSLPFGMYSVQYSDSFFAPAARDFPIDGPETLLILATRPAESDLGFKAVSLSLRIKPEACSAAGRLWVRLVGAFSGYSADRAVSAHGFVLFEPVYQGKYVAIVMDGEKIRGLQEVQAKTMVTTQEINLGGCP